MKRDMDLCRAILAQIEESNQLQGFIDLELAGHSDDEISYHVKILEQAGLVEAHDLSSKDGFCWKPTSLTYDGHEFLEATRSDTLWNRAKEITLKKTGGLALDVLKSVVASVAKDAAL